MKYFNVSFKYTGVKVNNPDVSDDACEALDGAIEEIESLLEKNENVKGVHAYSWTDGSLYYYMSAEDINDVYNVFCNAKLVCVLKIVSLPSSYEVKDKGEFVAIKTLCDKLNS